MNMEELFKNANQVMEREVMAPIVLAKLAERGYKPANEQEAQFLLTKAAEVHAALEKGEIQPIPLRAVDQQTGQLTKTAAESLEKDPLAFADEKVEVDLEQIDPQVKSAAYVIAGAMLEAAEKAQAEQK